MNDQVQKALADMINKIMSGADAVVDFSKQQIPELLIQFMKWKVIESLISMLVPALLLAVVLVITVKFWKKVTQRVSRDNDGCYPYIPDVYWRRDGALNFKYWFSGYVCPVLGIVLTIAFLANINFVWLQIWIAPKVFLLEYATSILKVAK